MIQIPLVISIIFLLNGCGALKTWVASDDQYDNPNATKIPKVSDEEELRLLAKRFGIMALFSKAVYRNDLDDSGNGGGCTYLNDLPKPSTPNYGMPGKWKRFSEVDDKEGPPCMDKNGLYYETYVHMDKDDKIDEAVIAFRGTENSKSQFLYDWASNVTAVFGFQPAEYKMARAAMKQLLAALKTRFKKDGNPSKIYATGHSLGGGLAQQLGYMSKDIKCLSINSHDLV